MRRGITSKMRYACGSSYCRPLTQQTRPSKALQAEEIQSTLQSALLARIGILLYTKSGLSSSRLRNGRVKTSFVDRSRRQVRWLVAATLGKAIGRLAQH